MSITTVACDPSVRFADTSPASLGRKCYRRVPFHVTS
jgi:hypothetical protein